MEGRRQRQPPGSRVQPGGEVDHEVGLPGLDGVEDDLVEHRRAHDHRPRIGAPVLHLVQDLPPAPARQPVGERIAEDRVGARGLHGPVDGHPARGVGDVLDGHGGSSCALWGV